MMKHARHACVAALVWFFPITTIADNGAIDFAAFYPLILDNGAAARRGVGEALSERFPPGTPLTEVVIFFERLAEIDSDDVGDPINIRYCRGHTRDQGVTCIWFADIPDAFEADALTDGIFGVTWEITVRSDGAGGVSDFGVDYLIEYL